MTQRKQDKIGAPELMLSYRPGILAMLGPMADLDAHRHHALQVVFPLSPMSSLEVNGEARVLSEAMLILPDTAHCFRSDRAGVLLINAESQAASELLEGLDSGSSNCSEDASPIYCIELPDRLHEALSIDSFIENFLSAYVPKACLHYHGDAQFEALFATIQRRIESGQLMEIDLDWACAQVHVSPGRFMHRFKELTGIPWRPFLLWSRLLSAVLQLKHGGALTEVAMAAGFADSAHFSRTFKANFGITPSKVMQYSRFIQA